MAPQEELSDSAFYERAKNWAVTPFIKKTFKPTVEGMENIPAEGPAIIASNHLSASDSVLLAAMLPRQIHFLAKKEYFTGPGVKGAAYRWFMSVTQQLPMDRSGGSKSLAGLHSGLRVLESGRLLGIYPEGTRSPDGRLYKGRTGIAKLLAASSVPVIPVAMHDTDKVQPIGSRLRIHPYGITVGKPLHFLPPAEGEHETRWARKVTDEIVQAIQTLSGQEYVDSYAPKKTQGE